MHFCFAFNDSTGKSTVNLIGFHEKKILRTVLFRYIWDKVSLSATGRMLWDKILWTPGTSIKVYLVSDGNIKGDFGTAFKLTHVELHLNKALLFKLI